MDRTATRTATVDMHGSIDTSIEGKKSPINSNRLNQICRYSRNRTCSKRQNEYNNCGGSRDVVNQQQRNKPMITMMMKDGVSDPLHAVPYDQHIHKKAWIIGSVLIQYIRWMDRQCEER